MNTTNICRPALCGWRYRAPGTEPRPTSARRYNVLCGSLILLVALPAWATTNALQSVSPSSAQQGTNALVVTFTLPATPPPPTNTALVPSVNIGTMTGTTVSRPTQYTVIATFNIPGTESVGAKDVVLTFPGLYGPSIKTGGFTVTASSTISAGFAASATNGSPPLVVSFTDTSSGTITNRLWDFGDQSTSTETNPVHPYYDVGTYTVSLSVTGALGASTVTRTACITVASLPTNGAYVVVDTGQTNCYNDSIVILAPASGQPFYGQDAQIQGHQPAYRDNGDGTISDLNTGLSWVKARGNQTSWADACSNAATCRVGGYSDWRMPSIKELYSLVKFTGVNGTSMTSSTGYVPFIDTNYFGFSYGGNSTNMGSRIIDAQDWSATAYVSTTVNGSATIFGYNFTDGRIKGYPLYDPSNASIAESNFVRYVRGNPAYGINNFVNNGDGTVSDKATRLMWSRNDSAVGMNWSNALVWVQAQNASSYLGHNDWRMPNAKELQSIVDYTRSPATTGSAAINPVFNCASITNELNQPDFPWYWTGTTLMGSPFNGDGVYVCFGRSMGYMGGAWVDAHGAGAQRSDAKAGSLTNISKYTYSPYGYYSSLAPQGDAVRIANHVRLVRDIPSTTAWRFAFVGDTHIPLTGVPAEIASSVVADDASFLIVSGDLVESGAGVSAATLQTQLTAWRQAFAATYASGVGVYVIRGNHEADVPNGMTAWTNFFSGSYAMPGNGPAGESNLTYSMTYSNALFVGFDDYITNQDHRINQAWFDQQCGMNTRPHLFVFGHEAAFRAFHTDYLGVYPSERNAFWSSLAASGARVYLCGHDHFLNVARIDNGDGNTNNDVYQCIVGTGGTTNWPGQRYNYNGTNAPYSPVNVASVSNTYGYLLVEVSGPGTNDLGVTLTWKERTYDTNTASYIYPAIRTVLSYSAVNRYMDSVGDGIPNWWRQKYFGGDGTTTNSDSAASADRDGDHISNLEEYLADTNPTNGDSRLSIVGVIVTNNTPGLAWSGGTIAWQSVERRHSLTDTNDPWTAIFTNSPPTAATNMLAPPGEGLSNVFYRVRAWR